jgi:hypothetical protein
MVDPSVVAAARESGFIGDRHEPLLARLEHFCRVAGIEPEDVFHGLSEHCTEKEINWFKQSIRMAKNDECLGLIYLGNPQKDTASVARRMRGLTAAYLRNYRDARVCTCSTLAQAGVEPPCTILLIPDFSSQPTDYESKRVSSILLARAAAGKPTVVHISESKNVKAWYGVAAASLLSEKYEVARLG